MSVVVRFLLDSLWEPCVGIQASGGSITITSISADGSGSTLLESYGIVVESRYTRSEVVRHQYMWSGGCGGMYPRSTASHTYPGVSLVGSFCSRACCCCCGAGSVGEGSVPSWFPPRPSPGGGCVVPCGGPSSPVGPWPDELPPPSIAGPRTGGASTKLSLIHISEPTRPY